MAEGWFCLVISGKKPCSKPSTMYGASLYPFRYFLSCIGLTGVYICSSCRLVVPKRKNYLFMLCFFFLLATVNLLKNWYN